MCGGESRADLRGLHRWTLRVVRVERGRVEVDRPPQGGAIVVAAQAERAEESRGVRSGGVEREPGGGHGAEMDPSRQLPDAPSVLTRPVRLSAPVYSTWAAG